jgi:hypothetical protein
MKFIDAYKDCVLAEIASIKSGIELDDAEALDAFLDLLENCLSNMPRRCQIEMVNAYERCVKDEIKRRRRGT